MSEIYDNIVFFDDDCILCNKTVQWLAAKDKTQSLMFTGLNSQFTSNFLPLKKIREQNYDSIILYSNSQTFLHSTAVLKTFRLLGFPYKMMGLLLLVPKFIRDFVYKKIAKNRKRFWSQEKFCDINLDLKERILN